MENPSQDQLLLDSVRSIVLKKSENLEGKLEKISGYDFNNGIDYGRILKSMISTGFQASNLGEAIEVVNNMLDWSLADEEPLEDCSEEEKIPTVRKSIKCKIFLGFTSNLISSGVRDIVRYLVEHKMVDVIVTTAGGIEEDLIKCLAPTYKGDFTLSGAFLRSRGLNRIGNLLVPNDNYCKFEDWITPILDQLLLEQSEKGIRWTPSRLIARLGKEIGDKTSYLYWAFKNNIPVYCPGLTDGSLGDMLYIHAIRNPGLVVDVVGDIKAMNDETVHEGSRKTGMIILGGGVAKHHICNANMMRNGADYAVFINTAQEFDGSDRLYPGAKYEVQQNPLRFSSVPFDTKIEELYLCFAKLFLFSEVHCDATIAFPLLVAETFARRVTKSINEDSNQ